MVLTPQRMALSGRLAEELRARLAEALPGLRIRVVDVDAMTAEDLEWADSYCGFAIPAPLADSNIRWIHLTAAGVDAAVPALRRHPSPPVLTRTVGKMPEKIAAYVVCHVLADFQRGAELARLQTEHRWEQLFPRPHIGRTAVVLGTGRVGAEIGAALRAVGFRVVGVSRSGRPGAAFDAVVTRDGARPELERCAVLVNALPLTDDTRHSVDAAAFGSVNDAVFVNIGRGATVVEADLRAALDAGRVRHAVLDVFEAEPLPAGSWMWDHERVTVTPHIAGLTDAEDVLGDLVAAYEELRAGRVPRERVDLGTGY